MHHPRRAGGHPRDCTRTEARRQAHLLRTWVSPRSPSASLAAAVGDDSSLAVPRLVFDTGYSGAPAAGWLQDRAPGGGAPCRILEVDVLLLAGHSASSLSH